MSKEKEEKKKKFREVLGAAMKAIHRSYDHAIHGGRKRKGIKIQKTGENVKTLAHHKGYASRSIAARKRRESKDGGDWELGIW